MADLAVHLATGTAAIAVNASPNAIKTNKRKRDSKEDGPTLNHDHADRTDPLSALAAAAAAAASGNSGADHGTSDTDIPEDVASKQRVNEDTNRASSASMKGEQDNAFNLPANDPAVSLSSVDQAFNLPTSHQAFSINLNDPPFTLPQGPDSAFSLPVETANDRVAVTLKADGVRRGSIKLMLPPQQSRIISKLPPAAPTTSTTSNTTVTARNPTASPQPTPAPSTTAAAASSFPGLLPASQSVDLPPTTATAWKPYACTVPHCGKSYKKLNGLLSHTLSAHPSQASVLGALIEAPQAAAMAAEAACVVSERGQPVVVVGAAAATASKSGAKVLTTDVVGVDEGGEKPYFCNMPGCEKRYRNSNGLAYHLEHGHCEPKAKKRIRRTKADFAAYLDHLDKGETPPSSTSTSSTTSLPDAMASLQAAAGGYSVKPYGAVAGENGDGGSGPAKKKKKKDDGVEREEAEEGKAVNKPFVCPHPGCRRAYKNKNGLVYHLEKGKGGHHNAPIPKS